MYDELWKGIIEKFFEEFCYFFLPDLSSHIDFEKGYEFLDKELLKISPEGEDTKRYTDKLVKVYFQNGIEQWINIHVEIQGYKDRDFRERMFIYYYRIYDLYKKKIAAIAVFTDDDKNYKPDSYNCDFFGTGICYKYRTYKILDADEEELVKSDNPFALACLAVKYSHSSGKDENKKLKFKLKLIRMMFKKGYSRKDIKDLFVFIDGLLKLNDIMNQNIFFEEIKKMEGGKNMQFISDFEEVVARKAMVKGIEQGMQIGIEQGIEKGIIKSVVNLLKSGFSSDKVKEVLKVEDDIVEKAKKEMEEL